jgi:hypothetical protein
LVLGTQMVLGSSEIIRHSITQYSAGARSLGTHSALDHSVLILFLATPAVLGHSVLKWYSGTSVAGDPVGQAQDAPRRCTTLPDPTHPPTPSTVRASAFLPAGLADRARPARRLRLHVVGAFGRVGNLRTQSRAECAQRHQHRRGSSASLLLHCCGRCGCCWSTSCACCRIAAGLHENEGVAGMMLPLPQRGLGWMRMALFSECRDHLCHGSWRRSDQKANAAYRCAFALECILRLHDCGPIACLKTTPRPISPPAAQQANER